MSYVTYDELGIVEIRCMNCGAPIVVRNYKKIITNSIPPKEINVLTMRQLQNFRKRKFDIESSAYVEVMLCDECVDLPISPDKMEKAIEDGWLTTWKHEKQSKGKIKELSKSFPLLRGSKKTKEKKTIINQGDK